MIYFGDGLTDVPSMKVVAGFGGNTIAVFKRNKDAKKLALDLFENKRATFMANADYSEGSKIDKITKGIIDKVAKEALLDEYR